MILDLEKLSKLEKKYANYPIVTDALSNMANIVSRSSDANPEMVGSVPFSTLHDLGLFKTKLEAPTKTEQLNS
jgi:hypothetical protein